VKTVDLDKKTLDESSDCSRESDWPLAGATKEDLPDGIYVVGYSHSGKCNYFEQHKIVLKFKIVSPSSSMGIEVALFATLPKQGKISPASKYYKLWCKANRGEPGRSDRMTPRVFHGYWRVRIEWSKPTKHRHGMPRIVELIEREAGS